MSDPFQDNPDLVACAALVEKADPDRFQAAMAAPVAARAVLFPIYAFNIEVARAPWASKEELIAKMRLQWWVDALDEIEAGGIVRRHEVVTPLAMILQGKDMSRLKGAVSAREKDLERAPFEDWGALHNHIDQTAGALTLEAAAALGARPDTFDRIAVWARAAGFARYLQAVPELVARGKLPLPDGRPEALEDQAREVLMTLKGAGSLRGLHRGLGPAGAAVMECWQAKALLQAVAKDPGSVADGRVQLSEFSKRFRLLIL